MTVVQSLVYTYTHVHAPSNLPLSEWNQPSCDNLNLFPRILQQNVRQDMSMHANSKYTLETSSRRNIWRVKIWEGQDQEQLHKEYDIQHKSPIFYKRKHLQTLTRSLVSLLVRW